MAKEKTFLCFTFHDGPIKFVSALEGDTFRIECPLAKVFVLKDLLFPRASYSRVWVEDEDGQPIREYEQLT